MTHAMDYQRRQRQSSRLTRLINIKTDFSLRPSGCSKASATMIATIKQLISCLIVAIMKIIWDHNCRRRGSSAEISEISARRGPPLEPPVERFVSHVDRRPPPGFLSNHFGGHHRCPAAGAHSLADRRYHSPEPDTCPAAERITTAPRPPPTGHCIAADPATTSAGHAADDTEQDGLTRSADLPQPPGNLSHAGRSKGPYHWGYWTEAATVMASLAQVRATAARLAQVSGIGGLPGLRVRND